MMKRRKGENILVTRNKNVFAGLWDQGVMLWGGAMIREAGEAIRTGEVVLTYGRVSSDGTSESRHGPHIVVGEVHKEVFSVFVS